MDAPRPPLEYLARCSQASLESLELMRLNRAANLRKEFEELLNQWIDAEADARMARTILNWRRGETPLEGPALICSAPAEARPPELECDRPRVAVRQLVLRFDRAENVAGRRLDAPSDQRDLGLALRSGVAETIGRPRPPRAAARELTRLAPRHDRLAPSAAGRAARSLVRETRAPRPVGLPERVRASTACG